MVKRRPPGGVSSAETNGDLNPDELERARRFLETEEGQRLAERLIAAEEKLDQLRRAKSALLSEFDSVLAHPDAVTGPAYATIGEFIVKSRTWRRSFGLHS